MKLYFMKEDALANFKGNVEYNLAYYTQPDNSWILEKYPNEPLLPCKFEIADLTMDMSAEKPEATDCNNVKIIYEALKNMSNTQATDERFWAGLSHGILWDYMQYRCKFNQENINIDAVLNNYFFNQSLAKSLARNCISRLWWIGRLLYNVNNEDPYFALNFLRIGFNDKIRDLFDYRFARNGVICQNLMIALMRIEDVICSRITREQYREILQFLNRLGGVVLLDYLSGEELQDKIIEHYFEINS